MNRAKMTNKTFQKRKEGRKEGRKGGEETGVWIHTCALMHKGILFSRFIAC
jgi:hypothetical protein